MPWKECKPMDERLRFIARLLEGEKMAPLCREFGISRVTGYKIFNRYKDCGLDGLNDRSRAPYRQANKLPFQIERTILGIKKEHPTWGARKIRDKLLRQFSMFKPPAISTVHAVLDRNGLVKRKKKRRHKASGTTLIGRSPSATIAPATSSPVRVSRPRVRTLPSVFSRELSRTSGCRMPCAPITACPSHPAMRCSA